MQKISHTYNNSTSAINMRERLDWVKVLEPVLSSLDCQQEDGGKEESRAGRGGRDEE